MDVRNSRKGGIAFDEIHKGWWWLAAPEATIGRAQKQRPDFKNVQLQVKWLATLSVPPSF